MSAGPRTSTDARAWARTGTELLLDAVAGLDEAAFAAPSALPDWTREHLAAHVAANVGPGCHFVHYALRGGKLLNQVAVFESPRALAGREDWGTPDELDAAFALTCDFVRDGLPFMWRDKWWRMFDRDPITTWVDDRIALLGDCAHPPRCSTSHRARSWPSRTAGCWASTLPATGPRTARSTGPPPSPPTRPSDPSTAGAC
ncbi:maleylpyruvate isomerase N-terminal domain-containing protein [Streptomyces sp. IBSBF 2394]|uniref:maleylpyruvate isomerase N-terminal domain-containing protein n=1 Tax=Streptomyces sp. IBSBF 2394 TaxID=2903532 RepID=UPI002FDB9EAD